MVECQLDQSKLPLAHEVVRFGLPDMAREGFVWYRGVMHPLGTLGGYWSEARGVNAVGEIVGASGAADGQIHAFFVHKGQTLDLNDLVCEPACKPLAPPSAGSMTTEAGPGADLRLDTLVEAVSINDAGQIIGCGTIVGVPGEMHGFRLSPVACSMSTSTRRNREIAAVCSQSPLSRSRLRVAT